MTEPKRESRLMIALAIAFAVVLVGGLAAVIAADSGSELATHVARFLVPTAFVLGVCLFVARILNL